MTCPRCRTENPPRAKCCLECAAPLAARCANCGTQLPPSAKFCLECAHPVSGATAGPPRFAAPESYTPKHLAEPRGMRPLVAHCHLGLGKLSRRTGEREEAREHLTTATTMYREMDMRFWLDKAASEERKLN